MTGNVYRDQPKRGGMFDFGVLPAEINSGRMDAGPGSAPMVSVSGVVPRRMVRLPVIS
jgi:hypothetical protein